MVITLDKNKRPLGWCTPKRARGLLKNGRAVVYRYYPFILILKDVDARNTVVSHNYRIKIDPGAKTTGIAITEEDTVILYAQIEHRGQQVVKNLQTRKAARRNRRSRETWYRHCKFAKGEAPTARPEGWLPPSQLSIANNVINFVNKMIRYLGPCAVSIESVKFDTQLLENPDIEGKQYQQGTLFGYEMKSFLCETYNCTCQYCGGKTGDHRLEWEHKIPRSRGGSDSVKNATLACRTCNEEKDALTPEEWLSEIKAKKSLNDLDRIRIIGIQNVISGRKTGGYRYAAWVNNTRWYLANGIKALSGITDIELSTGGRTAYNRSLLGYKKDHHIDALCVGRKKYGYKHINQPYLKIKAMGRGTRLRGSINKCGIITVKWKNRHKYVDGLQTGDIVRAIIPNSKYEGIYTGRIMVRSSGSHDIRCIDGCLVTGTKKSQYKAIQYNDGYQYGWQNGAIPLGN